MRKISAGLFISLNGVVEFPERWGFKYLSRDMSELIVAGIARADAVLLSPATYRFFARMWPHQADDVPVAKFLNHSPKYVVSRTPNNVGKLDWEPVKRLTMERYPLPIGHCDQVSKHWRNPRISQLLRLARKRSAND